MIKGVALGVTFKDAHREVLIDQLRTGKKGVDGGAVYHLTDNETKEELGTIIYDKKKDNWDYKGPLSHTGLYQLVHFIQNYSEDDWNF